MIIRKKEDLQIIAGPNKQDIFTAMAYAFDGNHPFFVDFTTSDGKVHSARIISITHESGSGSSFNLVVESETLHGRLSSKQVETYYETAKRTGVFAVYQDYGTDNNDFETSLRQVHGDDEADRILQKISSNREHEALYRECLDWLKSSKGLTHQEVSSLRGWLKSHSEKL